MKRYILLVILLVAGFISYSQLEKVALSHPDHSGTISQLSNKIHELDRKLQLLERKTSGFNQDGNEFERNLTFRRDIQFENSIKVLGNFESRGYIHSTNDNIVAKGDIVANRNLITQTGKLIVLNNQWKNIREVEIIGAGNVHRNCPNGMYVMGITILRGTCDNRFQCRPHEYPITGIKLNCASLGSFIK